MKQDNCFHKNDRVLAIMDAVMIAMDGEPLQDCANALQYVLNLIHSGNIGAQQVQGPSIGPQIP